jgi:hypothetical protein
MQPPQAHLPNSRTINILLLTGDSVASRVPQAVFLPPLLFATVQQDVAVHPLNQQLLYFHANDNLESQETVEADVLAAMIEQIRMWHAIYVTPHLVPLFLGRCCTPREDALMAVHTALIKTVSLETFKPLVD